MNKPILCVDFDGVIHSYTSGWQGEDVISDPPVKGAIQFLLEAMQHFSVVVYSSRSKNINGTAAMHKWLRECAGSDWHALENVQFAHEKPPAFLTIDDRAICFDGTWPSMETLKNFKPWNKK